VELGGGVAVDGPGGVMFELRNDEFPGCLRAVVPADPRLGIPL
jgi:hypothetical protein